MRPSSASPFHCSVLMSGQTKANKAFSLILKRAKKYILSPQSMGLASRFSHISCLLVTAYKVRQCNHHLNSKAWEISPGEGNNAMNFSYLPGLGGVGLVLTLAG